MRSGQRRSSGGHQHADGCADIGHAACDAAPVLGSRFYQVGDRADEFAAYGKSLEEADGDEQNRRGVEVQADGEVIKVDNPANLPESGKIREIREPIIEAHILVPQDLLGGVINLCIEKRGVQKQIQYLGGQVQVAYELLPGSD